MQRLPYLLVFISLLTTGLSCGSNRSLQSITISPQTAKSKAQFAATASYSSSTGSVDVTNSINWCVGSSSGEYVGFVDAGATVAGGLAMCLGGFTGTVNILAGEPVTPISADSGYQLKPYGSAQLVCP